MKSKDDKSEDGSDQERECLEKTIVLTPLLPLARSVHVLTRIYIVFYVFSLAVCIRLLYTVRHVIFNR